MKHIKKRALALLLVLMAVFMAGCAETAAEDDLKIALVVDGYINDKGWCQLAYEALLKAEEQLGAKISYSERTGPTDYENVISSYAKAGFDMIIAHGAEFYDVCKTLGAQYPNTQFIVTSSKEGEAPNVNGVFVGVYEAGFMNGVLAALMSESGKIGVIGGMELSSIASWVEGAVDGAKYVNEDMEVATVFTGSFEDAAKAREAAYALIESGCDVITQNADAASEGAIMACDDKGIINIGAVGDQNAMGEQVAVSVIQDTTQALFDVLSEGAAGTLKGEGRSVGVAQGCVYLTEYKDWVSEPVRTEAQRILEAIKNGEIPMK